MAGSAVMPIAASYNKSMRGLLLVVLLVLATTDLLQAQNPSSSEFPLGEIIEKVEVREDPSQSYALYLPPS